MPDLQEVVQITIPIPKEAWEELKKRAERSKMTPEEVIVEFLHNELPELNIRSASKTMLDLANEMPGGLSGTE